MVRSQAKLLCFIVLFALFAGCGTTQNDSEREEWITLFGGANYSDWTPKFAGYEIGINHKERFVFKDSLLSVRYTATDSFAGNFGHLFYKNPFSHYKLKATYRFIGEQQQGGPGWAFRNNGLMLHCQSPESMGVDQDFPISLELQLLGGNGTDPRTNANLCTPGTNVIMNDSLFTPHCVNSTSDTYHGDDWVEVEALVLGDSLIRHILDGKVVMEYRKPTMGGGEISGYDESVYIEEKAIDRGFISIQAETHPIDFKSIELLDLCGCMDPEAKNYKSYYVKNDPIKCLY